MGICVFTGMKKNQLFTITQDTTPCISHIAHKAKLQIDRKLDIISTQLRYTRHQAVGILQHTLLPQGPVPHIVRQWTRIRITHTNLHFRDVVNQPNYVLPLV